MADKKEDSKKVVKKVKVKARKKLSLVKIYLKAEFNNSIVTLTDLEGKVISWSSSGKAGFKGSRKSTPFAAQKAAEEILEKVREIGATSAHLIISGAGMGREAFLRAIQASDLQIESVKDVTGFPFGGITKRKQRRV